MCGGWAYCPCIASYQLLSQVLSSMCKQNGDLGAIVVHTNIKFMYIKDLLHCVKRYWFYKKFMILSTVAILSEKQYVIDTQYLYQLIAQIVWCAMYPEICCQHNILLNSSYTRKLKKPRFLIVVIIMQWCN